MSRDGLAGASTCGVPTRTPRTSTPPSEQLGRRVGIAGVLANLNRQAVRVPVPGRAVEWGFRWNDADGATERWWPQGITTSADASDAEDIDGRRLLMTSWYSKAVAAQQPAAAGSASSTSTPWSTGTCCSSYPSGRRRGPSSSRPLLVHAGGLVWCGPYLHVAGTRRGLFSCLVDDIIRVHDLDRHAFGYRYVLPVRFAYDAARERGRGADALLLPLPRPRVAAAARWSRASTAAAEMTRRLVRYPLDPETHHLAAHEDGTSRPVWLDERGLGHMQGACVVGRHLLRDLEPRALPPRPGARRAAGRLHARSRAPCRWDPRTSPTGPGPTCSGRSASTRAGASCSR